MKTFKAFIKPFEAPQGSVKIKILVNFCFNATFCNARAEGLIRKFRISNLF